MNVVSPEYNKLSHKRIELQNQFSKYTSENGFSYEEWLNPPAGSFFESYKKEIADINKVISPELDYH